MKNAEFLLGIFGLNRVERMTVASVCSLTHSRPRGYAVLPPERNEDAHIVLVDADDNEACGRWHSSSHYRAGRPALMISRNSTALSEVPYGLPRTNFASRLIKVLDQITVREFKFLPDLVVSDTNVLDAGLGLAAKKSATAAPVKAAPHALIIDDSVVVRNKMQALLQLHGIEVEVAADAEQGLQLLRQKPFAIVFLDVVLPGMDGYAACRQIKAVDKNAPPIIMLTGKDSPFDKIRGVMAGCSRYLTKPIAVDALNKVLQEFLPADTATPAPAYKQLA